MAPRKPRKPVEEPHPWGPACAHVNVYRSLRNAQGKEVRLVLTRYTPEELADELVLKSKHGPGHYVCSPRTAGNAIAGDEKRWVIPNDDGTIPPIAMEGDPMGLSAPAQGAAAPVSPWEMVRSMMADQRESARREREDQARFMREMIAEQRAARTADMSAMSAQFESFAKVVSAQAGGGVDGEGSSSLRKELKSVLDKLHKKELAEAAKSGSFEQFTTEVGKAVVPSLVKGFFEGRGMGAPAQIAATMPAPSPAPVAAGALVETAATVPLDTLAAQIPDAQELLASVERGETWTPDDVTCFTRLAQAGRLSDDHKRALAAYMRKNFGSP